MIQGELLPKFLNVFTVDDSTENGKMAAEARYHFTDDTINIQLMHTRCTLDLTMETIQSDLGFGFNLIFLL